MHFSSEDHKSHTGIIGGNDHLHETIHFQRCSSPTLAYIRESVPKNQKQKLIRRWVPKGGHPRAIFAVTNEGENPDCIIWKPGEPC